MNIRKVTGPRIHFFSNIHLNREYKFLYLKVNLFRKRKVVNTSLFVIKYRNSLKIFINVRFDIIKLNNKRNVVPVLKNLTNFGLVDKWLLALQEALNRQTSYINVFVVHKKYIQEWFGCIRTVKTLWLVIAPKKCD